MDTKLCESLESSPPDTYVYCAHTLLISIVYLISTIVGDWKPYNTTETLANSR